MGKAKCTFSFKDEGCVRTLKIMDDTGYTHGELDINIHAGTPCVCAVPRKENCCQRQGHPMPTKIVRQKTIKLCLSYRFGNVSFSVLIENLFLYSFATKLFVLDYLFYLNCFLLDYLLYNIQVVELS